MDRTIRSEPRRRFIKAVFSAAAVAGAPYAIAQTPAFPTRPVRMIVPFGAGGSVDVAARDLAQGLSQLWGQPVVVENHAGASSTVGNAIVARSPPDGYTLLFVSSHIVITPAMFAKLPYDPSRDFTPLTLAADVPIVLVVNPRVPARNVSELLALARKDPGKLTFASSGNGGMAHLSAEMFMSMTHTQMQHVPYKGDAPALNDLLGGQVDMMFCAASSAMPLIKAGKLRAIAWAGSESVPPLAELPTIAQSGVPGYAAASWVGLFGPGKMPVALRDRIAADATKVLSDPALRERQAKLGLQTATMTPQAFDRYVQAELPKWNSLVKSIGITMD